MWLHLKAGYERMGLETRSEFVRRFVWLLASGVVAFSVCLQTQPARATDAGTLAPDSEPHADVSLSWDAAKQGRYVCALTTDLAGNIWVGTENSGTWCFDQAQQKWIQYTTKDGIGEDTSYALACDKQGRIWAGHCNHGVSVFSWSAGVPPAPAVSGPDPKRCLSPVTGTWKNYGVTDGPLGERIWGITVSPIDGDVWIAHNAGLTRYRVKEDDWQHITRAEGLPCVAVTRVAFAANGDLYAATECDGLALARAVDSRTGVPPVNGQAGCLSSPKWENVHGVDIAPCVPSGEGLPSNLMNDVLVAKDGTVWVATTGGIAFSRDAGATWQFRRGADWLEKAKWLNWKPDPKAASALKSALAAATAGKPINETEKITTGGIPDAAVAPPLLSQMSEDYTTCLAEGANGEILFGHRRTGVDSWSPSAVNSGPNGAGSLRIDRRDACPTFSPVELAGGPASKLVDSPAGLENRPSYQREAQGDFIRVILPLSDGRVLAGGYACGLKTAAGSELATAEAVLPVSPCAPVSAPVFPRAASNVPATADELQAMDDSIRACGVDNTNKPFAAALEDDWTTRGDWLGRYGRYWACLCAFQSPRNYIWGAGDEEITYHAEAGPNHGPHDGLRHWVHWLYTDNANTLEMPPAYLHRRVVEQKTTWQKNRRQSEWDDHGEAYPLEFQGPNLYVSIEIPKGVFRLSFYDFNKDARGDRWESLNHLRDYRISLRTRPHSLWSGDISEFPTWPELARGRVNDFWGGVWKRFVVRGPVTVTAEFNRNSSYNTILAGAFLDLLDDTPPPYFGSFEQFTTRRAKSRSEALSYFTGTTAVSAVRTGETPVVLGGLSLANPLEWSIRARSCAARLLPSCERSDFAANPAASARVGCLSALSLFERAEELQRMQGLVPAREIEKGLRWDLKAATCSGDGRKLVEQHIRDGGSKNNLLAGTGEK